MSLLEPAAMWLILTVGWRNAYVMLGAAVLLTMLPLAAWGVRESPEQSPAFRATRASAGKTVDAVAAARTLVFWQLAAGLFSCGFSLSLLAAHGVAMLTDHGYEPIIAAWALGILGGSSIGFAVMLGAVADRIGRRPVLISIYAGRAVAIVTLLLVENSVVALFAVAVLGGLSTTGSVELTSALTAEIFGPQAVASVFGWAFVVHQVDAALGSWMGGAMFERNGSYSGIFVITSAILVGATLVTLTIDDCARRRPRQPTHGNLRDA